MFVGRDRYTTSVILFRVAASCTRREVVIVNAQTLPITMMGPVK